MFKGKKLYNSFKYAISGFIKALKEEQNLQIHLVASIIVLAFAFYFQLRKWEIITILLLIILVIVLELINTIFERLSDMLKPRLHIYVKTIKDMMAATVLIAVFGAVIIGLIIFYPYFANLLK